MPTRADPDTERPTPGVKPGGRGGRPRPLYATRTVRSTAAFGAAAVLVVCLLLVMAQARRQAQQITRLSERVLRAEDRREREQAYAQAKRSELAIRRAEIEARERVARRRTHPAGRAPADAPAEGASGR